MPEESLAETQKTMQVTGRRATRHGAVQGPTGQGGLSHLFPTNAGEIDMLYLSPTRDYIVSAYLRFWNCT